MIFPSSAATIGVWPELFSAQVSAYLKECEGLGVEAPVVSLLHGSLVGVVDEPALLQDLGADPLRLLHRLHQPLQRDRRLRRVRRQRPDHVRRPRRGLARFGLVFGRVP